MSVATDGFSAIINSFPMAVTGPIYRPRKFARKTSFASKGNVAKNLPEVKAGKFFVRPECSPPAAPQNRVLYKSARLDDRSLKSNFTGRRRKPDTCLVYEKVDDSGGHRRPRPAGRGGWPQHLLPRLDREKGGRNRRPANHRDRNQTRQRYAFIAFRFRQIERFAGRQPAGFQVSVGHQSRLGQRRSRARFGVFLQSGSQGSQRSRAGNHLRGWYEV